MFTFFFSQLRFYWWALTVFEFVFRKPTNNKTSLAWFNKYRKIKHGWKICFDHKLPLEVGESIKILEVLCNVLFWLHAPWGFCCCLHIGLSIGQVRGWACWIRGINRLCLAIWVRRCAGWANSFGSWVNRTGCSDRGGNSGSGTCRRIYRAWSGWICWRRSRICGCHCTGWVYRSRSGWASWVCSSWDSGASGVSRIGRTGQVGSVGFRLLFRSVLLEFPDDLRWLEHYSKTLGEKNRANKITTLLKICSFRLVNQVHIVFFGWWFIFSLTCTVVVLVS